MAEYFVSAGETSTGIILNAYDDMYVLNQGTANSTTVNSDGTIYVSSGGTASDVYVNYGGYAYLSSGASAHAIKENGGCVEVADDADVTFVPNTFSDLLVEDDVSVTLHSGTTANSTTVDYGEMRVYSGGVANDTSLGGFGTTMYVHSGGIANGTKINMEGTVRVLSGGVVTDTTLKGGSLYYEKAELHVSSGGTASDTIVKSNACTYVSSGGIIKGSLNVETGGSVSAYAGAIIDFTVAEQSSTAAALINDWSRISGRNDADYTITVNVSQTTGTYLLAGGANDFNKTVTVKTTEGATLGTITVGGTLVANDRKFALDENSGNLSLTVSYQRFVVTEANSPYELISGATYTNPTVYEGNGGAGEVLSGGTLTGSNVTFLNNSVVSSGYNIGYGGAIYISSGTVALSGSNVFSGNSATFNGGAICNEDGTVSLSGSNTFTSNFGKYGGAIYNSSGTFSLSGTNTFIGNSTYYSGGAICNNGKGNLSLSGTNTFISNSAKYGYGGAIYNNDESKLSLGSSNTFTSNSVSFDGGAICNYGDISLSGSNTFSSNSATFNGGAICNYGGHVTLSGYTLFSGNTATRGGAIYNLVKVNLAGEVTLGTDTDTILNYGTINWDLTGEVKAKLNGYEYLTNSGDDAKLVITVKAEQALGKYTIATGNFTTVTGKNTFYVTGLTGDDAVITINGESEIYNGKKYSLRTLSSGNSEPDKLILKIADLQEVPVVESVTTSGYTTSIIWTADEGGDVDAALSKSDAPEKKLTVTTDGEALDVYAMPESYNLTLKYSDGSTWSDATPLTAAPTEETTEIVSNANGKDDLFFANVSGKWGGGYSARNVGSTADWDGTNERVGISGKNKIADTFTGSDDANVLVLTDDTNGDVLFVDDIFTAFPGEEQARIAKINEIRAGAGDDVVDATSKRYEYIGTGITIRGGDGNDVIWANKGSNVLLGDDGDDRLVGASGNDVIAGGFGDDTMHGGGGNDVFCFCENWGSDTIEQTSAGTVTLWFKDTVALTLIYVGTDTVINSMQGTILAKNMMLSEANFRFGTEYGGFEDEYAELSKKGAFLGKSSTAIFAAE